LQLIHADLVGPLPTTSLQGSRYFVVFTDDHSRKSWVFFLKSKAETFSKFCYLKSIVERETGKKISMLRTDRGGEFMSQEFRNFCNKHGIRYQLTQALTPEQNGVAERCNRTIVERARSMVVGCNLPGYLWPEVINTTNYLVNRNSTTANKGVTPEERYSSRKPDVSFLRVFGYLAYLHVPKKDRSKL
jgi:transposase InsO family protein